MRQLQWPEFSSPRSGAVPFCDALVLIHPVPGWVEGVGIGVIYGPLRGKNGFDKKALVNYKCPKSGCLFLLRAVKQEQRPPAGITRNPTISNVKHGFQIMQT